MGDVLIAWTFFVAHRETEVLYAVSRKEAAFQLQWPEGQNSLLMYDSSTYLSFTFMENKDPLCLFDVISKVICIGFIMERAPENLSHV